MYIYLLSFSKTIIYYRSVGITCYRIMGEDWHGEQTPGSNARPTESECLHWRALESTFLMGFKFYIKTCGHLKKKNVATTTNTSWILTSRFFFKCDFHSWFKNSSVSFSEHKFLTSNFTVLDNVTSSPLSHLKVFSVSHHPAWASNLSIIAEILPALSVYYYVWFSYRRWNLSHQCLRIMAIVPKCFTFAWNLWAFSSNREVESQVHLAGCPDKGFPLVL